MYASGKWPYTKSHEYKESTIVTDQHNVAYFNPYPANVEYRVSF